MEVRQSIRNFVTSELIADPNLSDIGEAESLLDNGILDSLGIMKLIDFIEESFAVKISDEELIPENFESLESISKLINSKFSNERVN